MPSGSPAPSVACETRAPAPGGSDNGEVDLRRPIVMIILETIVNQFGQYPRQQCHKHVSECAPHLLRLFCL